LPSSRALGAGKDSSKVAPAAMSALASSSAPPPPGGKSKVGKCFVRCLRRLGDINSNRHVILESGMTCWIGRSEENQLSLPDVVLSRKQAEIKEETDNKWTITDNKSANGTKLNDTWLQPMQPHLLNDRDVVQFGPDAIQAEKCFRYMFHRALKFSRHPSIPIKAVVDESGVPSKKRRSADEAETADVKRLKSDVGQGGGGGGGGGGGEGEAEILAFQKQMKEMKEKIRLQDEEMEEVKRRAAEELARKLAEGEVQLRLKAEEEGESSRLRIEESLRAEIRQKEASHEEAMERVRRDFDAAKARLHAEKEQTTEELLARQLAEKEAELAEKLAAATRALEAEKAAMEKEIEAELVAKKEEEERKIKGEIEERRRVIREEQERMADQAEEKRRAMEIEMKNRQAEAEGEKAALEREMKSAFAAELKRKEEKIREELDGRKEKLERERKKIEESLQVEMNKKLEEKDKTLREELIKQRDLIAKEIQMRQAKEAQLETEIAVLQMSKEDTETESKRNILTNLEATMEEELQCAICTELFIEATALNCAHSFCQYCIKEWRKNKNECPVCRVRITTETRALVLDSYIDKMVQHLSEEMKERRNENVTFRESQKQGKAQPSTSGPSTTVVVVDQPHVTTISSDDDDDDGSRDGESDEDSNSSATISGDEDAPYGGYGSCYICGHRGHWAPGCPRRYY